MKTVMALAQIEHDFSSRFDGFVIATTIDDKTSEMLRWWIRLIVLANTGVIMKTEAVQLFSRFLLGTRHDG